MRMVLNENGRGGEEKSAFLTDLQRRPDYKIIAKLTAEWPEQALQLLPFK